MNPFLTAPLSDLMRAPDPAAFQANVLEENRILRRENSSLISLCANLEERVELQRELIRSLRLELGEDPRMIEEEV